MNIGIYIDDILSDFSYRFLEIYEKYAQPYGFKPIFDYDTIEQKVWKEHLQDYTTEKILIPKDNIRLSKFEYYDDNFDLRYEKEGVEYEFDFINKEQFLSFLYNDAALELFGHCDIKDVDVINYYNSFFVDTIEEEEHKIILMSRAINKSVSAYCFFLAKTATQFNDLRFYLSFDECWNDVDIMFSANPNVLLKKPSNKLSIKLENSYNKDIDCDYSFDDVLNLFSSYEDVNEVVKKLV
jgi:hypothetical protein